MKALLASLSVIAVLGLAAPAFAGPNVGDPPHGMRATKHMREMRERRAQAAPYALTGVGTEAKEYRWERKLEWIGGTRDRRVTYVRVPVN